MTEQDAVAKALGRIADAIVTAAVISAATAIGLAYKSQIAALFEGMQWGI